MEPEPEPEPEERIFIPPDFYCPITGDLLVEPVTDPAGHTYEKTSILKWLGVKNVSPLTQAPLYPDDLTDNIAMKRSIDSIRDKLQSDQLKVESKIMDTKLAPYKEKLDEITIDQYYHNGKLVVSINTPEVQKRPPIDIVLCIDVSYSMSAEATLKGNKNEKISHGMSVLSLTISAAKTILYSLEDEDNISIVTFSSHAVTVVKNQACTAENKTLISSELDSLKPVSNTNMWSGIIASLDTLKETSPPEKNKGVILLTDGIPNVEPPRGHEAMLEKYFTDHDFRCMVSTYGFGYNLDSNLLLNISNISGGDGYSFIPDASILGSVFINGISNLLTTSLYNPKLRIDLSHGAKFKDGNSSFEITIDSLKYGKSKTFVFDIDFSKAEPLVQRAHSARQSENKQFTISTLILPHKEIVSTQNTCNVAMIQRELIRVEAIDTINQCIDRKKFNDDSFKTIINDFYQKLVQCHSETKDTYIHNILLDFAGQVKEALNMTSNGEKEDWFSRWGVHYLRSLQGAYMNEMCNNFKDKGILNFKTPMFDRICDNISTVFEAIPPPKPDIVRVDPPVVTTRGGMSMPIKRNAPAPLRSMSAYNNAGGGCCIGNSGVLMANKTIRAIQDIKKGDRIFTCDPNNYNETPISEVECLVYTESYGEEELLSTISNQSVSLSLTPYHPVINSITDKWIFPKNIAAPQVRRCRGVYTIVVKNRYPIIVQGFTYATLGHQITGEVIGHPFFGSERVINDLKKINTYDEGYVHLNKEDYKRENDIVVAIEKR
jgi:hypothetical protein